MDRDLSRSGLLKRVACESRQTVRIRVDGEDCVALAGDTLLVAVLTSRQRLRTSEFGDGARAGFCMMGACQDCWVVGESGERLRACSTTVAEGMSITTVGGSWLRRE